MPCKTVNQQLEFGEVNTEMLMKYPSRNVEEAVGV